MWGLWAVAVTPKTRVCNFEGANRNQVYTIHTTVGVGTTFRLPDGWEISDFVVTDTKYFHGESNGVIATVKALENGHETSVILYTGNDRLFVFHLTSDKSGPVDSLVVIEAGEERLYSKRTTPKTQAKTDKEPEADPKVTKAARDLAEAEKQRYLFGTHTDYRVRNNHFAIKRVVDDGVFTYVHLPDSQERPAVFVSDSRDAKTLQPVKYVDNGTYYVVHRVVSGRERLYLKAGERIAEIRRR